MLTQAGDINGSLDALETAKVSLQFEDRKYWIVGLGSYWCDYVVTELGETGPCPIVKEPNGSVAEQCEDLVEQLFRPEFLGGSLNLDNLDNRRVVA